MKEFEWFEWFGPSPIEPFNSGSDARMHRAKGVHLNLVHARRWKPRFLQLCKVRVIEIANPDRTREARVDRLLQRDVLLETALFPGTLVEMFDIEPFPDFSAK